MGNIADTGVADIHVACRFNNQLILELLISQGNDIHKIIFLLGLMYFCVMFVT
jgi:hypothetical protein